MNGLIKLLVSFTAVKWLKDSLRYWGLPVLVIIVFWFAHSEYLDYLERISPTLKDSSSTFLAESYFLKWFVTLAAIAWIWFSVSRATKQKRNARSLKYSEVLRDRIHSQDVDQLEDDGFDFLRKKKHLETRAEKIIKGKKISDKNQ